VAIPRPADVFDRVLEWEDLTAFATSSGPGLRIAVVHGRRRQGKSYLLRRLASATGGFYYQAIEEEPAPALARLGRALGAWLGVPGGGLTFSDWDEAVNTLTRLSWNSDKPVVAIIDELSYLLDRVPELSSLLQRAADASRDVAENSVRLVLCGSALSVMTGLLAGQRALRGRVSATVQVNPFDFRDAASYWGLGGNWPVAVRLDAILGGTPGYRDLLALDSPQSVAGIGGWLAAGVCNPSSAMFREDDYLLAEERGLTDRALYHSVLSAVAAGNITETVMASALGRDRQAIAWPLRVLVGSGFLVRDDDALRQRRPTYRIAEPIVRFHHVVTRQDLARFEERRAADAWADAQPRFATHVLGPHFENLARFWTARYAVEETLGGPITRVGATQLSDPVGRSQVEIDVVAVSSGRWPKVVALGEAKFGTRPIGIDALARLERAREILTTRGHTGSLKLVLFSAGGFNTELVSSAQRRPDLELVDLERLYTGS